jgi:UDP-2,4-diacetamido-2,4,6-trideoxy-beta-L-altropyranose hydrolase
MMRVVFRADASIAIGIGHVTRCLNLARVLRAQGAQVSFLCRATDGHAGPLIAENGFPVVLLPAEDSGFHPPHGQGVWERREAIMDADACCMHLDGRVDWLVVDHYGLDACWESAMRSKAHRIMVIDDLADRQHDCELLLDQNLVPSFETRYRQRVSAHCRCLLGPGFALVDDSFGMLAGQARVRRHVQRLLFFFGGGDAGNLTAFALRDLEDLGIESDVVAGRDNPNIPELRALCAKGAARSTLHVQTRQMAALMLNADLMIGAGGTTHWERCLLGLPAITITVAANQVPVTEMLASAGTCVYAAPSESLKHGEIRQTVERLMADPCQLEKMSRAAREIVPDGNGKVKVAAAMGLVSG